MTKKILKFYSNSCHPCKVMEPEFNRFCQDISGVSVESINSELDRDAVKKYGVRSVPTIIFLKNGMVVNQLVGLKNYNDLMRGYDFAFGDK